MDFELSARSRELRDRVRAFIAEHLAPVEHRTLQEIASRGNGGDWKRWRVTPLVEALKEKARAEGLWNLFLPENVSTLDYAPAAEEMGRSILAPEAFNCSAPDTGNMEVLWRYGSAEQKRRWLEPLLDGTARSVFCMTEPEVASSDATNMAATAVVDGAEVVLNGRKWWATGAGHPQAKVAVFMGRTPDPARDRHHQHSMVLVPLDTPGVTIERMLPVFGEYEEPNGHGEILFRDVRVPAANVIGAPGMGFEIAQGRLGPGRIHHCMRCLGAAEAALELMVARGSARTAFGKPLLELGGNRERVAEVRIAIDQARLLTLHAAWKLDRAGVREAMTEISAIKVAAPAALELAVDHAIQIHGGAGLARETPLPLFYLQARSLRIADGPDEVHKHAIARREIGRLAAHRRP